ATLLELTCISRLPGTAVSFGSCSALPPSRKLINVENAVRSELGFSDSAETDCRLTIEPQRIRIIIMQGRNEVFQFVIDVFADLRNNFFIMYGLLPEACIASLGIELASNHRVIIGESEYCFRIVPIW